MILKPIYISILTLIFSLLVLSIILYICKPSFVMVLNKFGEKELSLKLIISYSITFSILLSTSVLLITTHKRNKVSIKKIIYLS